MTTWVWIAAIYLTPSAAWAALMGSVSIRDRIRRARRTRSNLAAVRLGEPTRLRMVAGHEGGDR